MGMIVPAHIGLEHPNALWLLAVGVCAFVAGLGVNLYVDRADSQRDPAAGSERT
jgi:hypothetical protein